MNVSSFPAPDGGPLPTTLASPNRRRVACLLGLPFDLIGLEQACARMRAEPPGSGAILSTPNVNWVMLARDHPWLRDSVLASALSVVDGMPLVLLGRLTGIAFPERVSGADLFEGLRAGARPWRVFFFGGQGDVAERASVALDAKGGALSGAGGLNPGRGDLDSMSAEALLAPVRAARANLVVVSLGALRGQAWVMRNHARLQADWVTHLGAVVNFVAGDVRRAPPWVARGGIEWIWRIAQEPALWQRYGRDGLRLLGLLATRIAPLLLWQRWHAPRAGATPDWQPCGDGSACMAGAWCGDADQVLERELAQLAAATAAPMLTLDLSQLAWLCPLCAGQLLVCQGRLAASARALRIVRPSPAARRLLRGYGADDLIAAH